MIKTLFLTLPPGTNYEQLKSHIHFIDDFAGAYNWAMRFPRIIYSVDLKTKHIFNENQVELEKVNNPNLEQRWKYFVITKGDGHRYYCTSQIYYEKGSLKHKEQTFFSGSKQIYRQYYLPKCLVLLSELPYYKLQVNLLKVYRELKKPSPIISHSINENLYKIYLYLIEHNRPQQWQNLILKHSNQHKNIRPSPEFVFNYYVACCNEHKIGEAIYIQQSTNREVLHIYSLFSNSLYQISYIFHLPFTPDTLRVILSAIFQEKQIIFTSNNQNLTTLIIQTLMKMIMPLKWCYMYVPNLPSHLIEPAQESFMPYIVGIAKKNMHLIDTKERVVIYVQQNKVVYSGQLYLFHHSLCEHLYYINNDSKNYFQWQKQIKIKSILLIHIILQDCLKKQHYQQTQRTLRQSTVSLTSSTAYLTEHEFHQNRFSQHKILSIPSVTHLYAPHAEEFNHSVFLNQFISNSMMFKNFKEDSKRGLTEETIHILNIPRQQRKSFLINRYNFIAHQMNCPNRFNNEKHWLKYYDKSNRNRRKFRFNRLSLNMNEQSTVSHYPLKSNIMTNKSLIASNVVKINQSRVVTQSHFFH